MPPPNLADLIARTEYPGMTAAEAALVRAFLHFHGAEWDTADVEAKIGRGVILPPTVDPKAREDWERRTRARPDLVLTRAPNTVAIVEAKEQLTNEGIWQVLSYRDLWVNDHPTDRVQVIAIAYGVTPTAHELARIRGVQVTLYVPAPRPIATDIPAEQGGSA